MMRTTRRLLALLLLGTLLFGLAPRDAAAQHLERGVWDQLAQWVIPRFVAANEDLASIIEQVRRASCTVNIELKSAAFDEPMTGVISYEWEDFNDSGMLNGRELKVNVEHSSRTEIDPYLKGVRDYLEDQTTLHFPFLFQINDVRAVRIPGGYKLRLRPAVAGPAHRLLGYEVAYLTLTDDFRATEMQTKSENGMETVFRFKHRKVGNRWLSGGYLRRITTSTARAEEDRTEVYELVSGVHLLKKVTIDTFLATANGAAQAMQTYTFADWQIEKRDHTVIATGIRAEGIMQAAAPGGPAAHDFRLAKTLGGHGDLVLAVVWSPDGKLIASASMDKTIRLWDPATSKCTATLKGHTTPINALAFSADSKLLISGGGNGASSVRAWDVAKAAEIKQLEGAPKVVFALACSPDGKQIAAGGQGGEIAVWDAKTYQRLDGLTGHLFDVYALNYTPANPRENNAQALLASASADRTARLWKVADTTWPGSPGENFGTFQAERQLASVAASWNGQRVAAAGTAKVVQVWDPATGRLLHTLEGHRGWVECLAFSPVPGSATLVSGSRDRWIRVWDTEAGKCVQVLEDHDATVRALAFAPDGNRFASASDDRTVRLWARGTPLPKTPTPPATITTPKSGAAPKK